MAKLVEYLKASKKNSILFLLLILILSVLLYLLTIKTSPNPSSIKTQSGVSKIPNFKHVFIVTEENHGFDDIINNTQAEFINSLANNYSLATNFHALTHPSLPNYIEMTSGTNGGINTDCEPSMTGCQTDAENITDRIEGSGRNWKAYFESMPASCTTSSSGLYAVRHNPFVYSKKLPASSKHCEQHVVPLPQLYADLLSGETLPNFIFIVPNLCNDMHDCPVNTGDQWLAQLVPKLLNSPASSEKNSLLILMWDESKPTDSQNHIPFIIAGQNVRKGYTSSMIYNHYSLLSTIEKAWDLQPLTTSDKNAPVMREFFN